MCTAVVHILTRRNRGTVKRIIILALILLAVFTLGSANAAPRDAYNVYLPQVLMQMEKATPVAVEFATPICPK